METSELKIKSDLLDEIKELEENVYELNQAQKDRIEEARSDYKNSQTLTEEQANNEIDEWLNEK